MAHGSSGSIGDGPWWSLSQWDVLALAVLAAMLAAYLFLAWRSYRRTGTPDRRAVLAWTLGLAAVFVAISSPLVSLVRQESGSHLMFMVQLELLMSVSPPLLLLGLRPMLSLFPEKDGFVRGAFSRPASVPALTLSIWLFTVYAWHLPDLHMHGMQSGAVYAFQLFSFMAAGLLFWLPVIGVMEMRREMQPLGKLGYLALAQAGIGLFAAVLIFYPEVIYAHGDITQPFGLSGLTDQKVSGVVMMVVDMTVASTVVGWIFFRALRTRIGGAVP